MSNLPEKFKPIKDSYEVVIFAFKVYLLTQKHSAADSGNDSWFKKLLAKADYLTLVPYAVPAFQDINNCLAEIKDPAKVRLIGEAVAETLDLPNDNIEARIKKVVLATSKYTADLQEAFA